jgi:hypothetical protein
MCSRAARSLWLDLLGLMHESDRYGFLLIAGTPPSNAELAIVLGDSEAEIATLMSELAAKGVYSTDENGTVYSRRMIRDESKSQAGRQWASKRWANGTPNEGPIKAPIGPENIEEIQCYEDTPPNGSPNRTPITPDTRYQILEREDPNGSPNGYAFKGKLVRLTPADYETWKRIYHAIPDIDAELMRIDTDLNARGTDNWFIACSNMLSNKHQRLLLDRKPVKPSIRPLGVGG